MKIMIKLFTLFAFSLFPTAYCFCTNWLVGPTHTYTKPSQVSTLVQQGDTVSIDAGTYTADVAHWTANNILLRGVGGGYAHLNANNISYGRKGIWVIDGTNTTIQNIEFSNCHDVAALDLNWAGIRFQGSGILIHNCYFHDNDDGILDNGVSTRAIIIEFTEFKHNGYGDGYSHNLYIGHSDTLIFRYNYSHLANIGHELKSRAKTNYILYNRFSNEATGTASRDIDLPNGGMVIAMGNIIEQGPNAANSAILEFGLEGLTNPSPHNFYFINNTVVNDKSNGTFIQLQTGMDLYKAYNNIFAGAGNLFTGSATAIDTAHNWVISNIASVGFMNAANYDYHLIAGSLAINAGTNSGTASNGFSLTPTFQYSHPANDTIRNNTGTIDIGAYEFAAATGLNNISDLHHEFHYRVAEGSLIIETSLSPITINIYDPLGRKIITQQIQSGITQLDISNLSRGKIYFLEARTEKGIASGKFIR